MPALKSGTVTNYNDSMAQEIELALKALWPEIVGGTFPETGPQHYRLLTLAIAQGVVNHLMKNNEFRLIHPAGPEIRMNAQGIKLIVGSTQLEVTADGVNVE